MKKTHDHRPSIWILGIGPCFWLWCYRCGAIRPNREGRSAWTRPTEDPAMVARGLRVTERAYRLLAESVGIDDALKQVRGEGSECREHESIKRNSVQHKATIPVISRKRSINRAARRKGVK